MPFRPKRIADLAALALLAFALVSVGHVSPLPLDKQPFPDPQEYASSAQQLFDGHGYVTYVHGPVAQAPRYPPGLPLLLAPFGLAGHYSANVQRGATVLALLYVVAVVGAAWALGGSLAAILAGLIVVISPFARENAQYVLSDGVGAALLVVMLPILHRRTAAGERLGGALMGIAAIVRITSGVGLLATLVAVPLRSYRRVLAFAIPFLLGVGLLQWAWYGNPFYTGYDFWGLGFDATFKLENVFGSGTGHEGAAIFTDLLHGHLMNFTCPCGVGGSITTLPNFWFYLALLMGGFWVYSPPLLPLLGLWWAWHHRHEAVGRYALTVVVVTFVVFAFYADQASRFMAGPASVLLVLSAVALTDGLRKLAVRTRSKWSGQRPLVTQPAGPTSR